MQLYAMKMIRLAHTAQKSCCHSRWPSQLQQQWDINFLARHASSLTTSGHSGKTNDFDLPRLRIASINDVYDLSNLPRMQTFLRQLHPTADIVCLAGDFLSPSPLSALDGGKGMVATLRALGMTHVSLGNHEADLRLHKLQKRLRSLQTAAASSKSSVPKVLNTNILGNQCTSSASSSKDDKGAEMSPVAPWMNEELHRYDIVTTQCGRVRIGVLGLMSDEAGMFRDGTFRGVPIQPVTTAFSELYEELVMHLQPQADWLLPLTHCSIHHDEHLAKHMLTVQPGPSIILGGHEHVPFDVRVENEHNDEYVRILKSGTDAMGVSLVDLYFDVHEDSDGRRHVRVADIDYELVDIRALTPSMVIQNIVDQHQSILFAMENEDVLHADSLLPPGEPLSSEGTRIRQTTLGGILCTCIKEELETDVAILNGAVIKGNTTYDKPCLTYAQIRKELPFPTKIVVVPMKRWELQAAIDYSRRCPVEADEDEDPNKPVQRRGFLQVDLQFNHYGFHTGDQEEELQVALPRNLLNGFCKILPLMEVGDRLRAEGIFPEADEFIPAMDLVIRHSSKERWYELIHDNYTFTDLDPDAKGYLSREDVTRIIAAAIQHDPPEFLVDDMMSAIDADGNGVVDPGELSHLLAIMEREHGFFRFDD